MTPPIIPARADVFARQSGRAYHPVLALPLQVGALPPRRHIDWACCAARVAFIIAAHFSLSSREVSGCVAECCGLAGRCRVRRRRRRPVPGPAGRATTGSSRSRKRRRRHQAGPGTPAGRGSRPRAGRTPLPCSARRPLAGSVSILANQRPRRPGRTGRPTTRARRERGAAAGGSPCYARIRSRPAGTYVPGGGNTRLHRVARGPAGSADREEARIRDGVPAPPARHQSTHAVTTGPQDREHAAAGHPARLRGHAVRGARRADRGDRRLH